LNNRNGPIKPIKTDKEKQEIKRATSKINLARLCATATFLTTGKFIEVEFFFEFSVIFISYSPFLLVSLDILNQQPEYTIKYKLCQPQNVKKVEKFECRMSTFSK